MSEQLDFESVLARQLRDVGITTVLEHTAEAWKEKVRKRIISLPSGSCFTMDRVIDDLGGRPDYVHPNSSGGLTFGLVKQGLIKRTGLTVKAGRASRHCADAPEWVRL